MKKLLDYLYSHYEPGEPILIKDINIDGYKKSTIRVYFKRLVEQEKIRKVTNGAYSLPKVVNFRDKKFTFFASFESVAYAKYLKDNEGNAIGYYNGNTLLNMVHLSKQVPHVPEIRTNNTKSIRRKIIIKNHAFVLRKSYVTITSENIHVLEILELLKDIDKTSQELGDENAREMITNFISAYHITLGDIKEYIGYFPKKVYQNIFLGGYYELFLQQP